MQILLYLYFTLLTENVLEFSLAMRSDRFGVI